MIRVVKVHVPFAKLPRSIAIFLVIFNDWFCVGFFLTFVRIKSGEVREWFQPEAHAGFASEFLSTERCESGFSRRLIRQSLWRRIGRIAGRKYMFSVYVLWSEKLNKRYVGSSDDLERRVKQHNRGASRFTSGGIPWKVVHSEEFSTKREARIRELFLKSGVGRKWLDDVLHTKD